MCLNFPSFHLCCLLKLTNHKRLWGGTLANRKDTVITCIRIKQTKLPGSDGLLFCFGEQPVFLIGSKVCPCWGLFLCNFIFTSNNGSPLLEVTPIIHLLPAPLSLMFSPITKFFSETQPTLSVKFILWHCPGVTLEATECLGSWYTPSSNYSHLRCLSHDPAFLFLFQTIKSESPFTHGAEPSMNKFTI